MAEIFYDDYEFRPFEVLVPFRTEKDMRDFYALLPEAERRHSPFAPAIEQMRRALGEAIDEHEKRMLTRQNHDEMLRERGIDPSK